MFQGPVRRIRSLGPSGPGTGHPSGPGGRGPGLSLTQGRRGPPAHEDPGLRREVEELRTRTANMEKTMRSGRDHDHYFANNEFLTCVVVICSISDFPSIPSI